MKKWIYLALFLSIFYFIFIANFVITFSIIIGAYIVYRLYKVYARFQRNKLLRSKEVFASSDLGLFIALVAKVAKADGRVQELEAQLISNMFDDICRVFNDKEKARALMKEIFNDSKQRNDDTQELARQLNLQLGKSILKRRQFMSFLIQLAFIDNGISEDENRVLQTIAQALQIDPRIFDTIKSRFENMNQNTTQAMSANDAYKVLGVNESDDMDTIKKRYRKLIREYHPDIISSQDKDESYIEEATAKTQEINQAYQVIKDLRKQ
ncbi:MAG TPA: molecular chaperone DjlA [Arcobacter sp.]|jgi:DnaJ like chaperone protein|nr:molecular chaperone DjlA [Arcobacter sp.]